MRNKLYLPLLVGTLITSTIAYGVIKVVTAKKKSKRKYAEPFENYGEDIFSTSDEEFNDYLENTLGCDFKKMRSDILKRNISTNPNEELFDTTKDYYINPTHHPYNKMTSDRFENIQSHIKSSKSKLKNDITISPDKDGKLTVGIPKATLETLNIHYSASRNTDSLYNWVQDLANLLDTPITLKVYNLGKLQFDEDEVNELKFVPVRYL